MRFGFKAFSLHWQEGCNAWKWEQVHRQTSKRAIPQRARGFINPIQKKEAVMNMKKAAGLMFVAMGGAGLLAACGLEPSSTCAVDSDCIGVQVCHQSECVNQCATDNDCLVGEACLDRPGGLTGKVCQPGNGGGGGNNEPECTTQEDCDEGFMCINDMCIPQSTGPTYYNIEIRDTSSGEICSDVTYGYNTPGAKIMYVALLDAEGNTLAWGEASGANLAGDTDYEFAYEIIDGNAPNYSGECPELVSNYPRKSGGNVSATNFTDDAIVALGCGGSLFVSFKGPDNNRIALEAGDQLYIGEYGKDYCVLDGMSPPQSRDAEYAVYLCTATSMDMIDNGTCTHRIRGGLSGINQVSITLP
jgi:hypothetical protein